MIFTANLLISLFYVAFNHDTFHKIMNILRMGTAVEHLFYNPYLLLILLTGIRMDSADFSVDTSPTDESGLHNGNSALYAHIY